MMNASTICLTISPHIVVVKATTDKGYITLVLSSAVEKLIEALKDFGLSEYEAKVLLTLIAKGELTAKEISEFSGVPRTSVYEVVRSLTNKGLVIASGKPLKFRALPANELMRLFSRRLQDNIELLKKELPNIEKGGTKREEVVKVYTGEMAINALRECIEEAEKEIIVATTSLDERIKELLKDARCRVVVMAPNAESLPNATFYQMDVNVGSIKHGMLLIDGIKVAIYLTQSETMWLMMGSGGFAEFYREFLNTFIKQKLRS
jgi:sugar-specific transcriptional regulator TrmB